MEGLHSQSITDKVVRSSQQIAHVTTTKQLAGQAIASLPLRLVVDRRSVQHNENRKREIYL